MSIAVLKGNASGTGTVTIETPNTNTDRTLTLPDATGTLDRLNRAGNVLQVVSTNFSTQFSTSSTTDVSTGMNLSITPSSSSSKILIILTACCRASGAGGANAYFIPTIYRNTSTKIWDGYAQGGNFGSTDFRSPATICYLDSPATTSSTNYLLGLAMISGTSSVWLNANGGTSTITLMEIAA